MQGIPRPLQFRFFGLGRLRFVYKLSFQGKVLFLSRPTYFNAYIVTLMLQNFFQTKFETI